MKKLISLLTCICMLVAALPVYAADIYIELDPLRYEEYMRGETILISGSTNTYVTLGLYYPEHYGSSAKYILTYSPSELSDGIELETDTDDKLWPDGVWTIIVQSGEVSESLEFTLCEFVDRTEEPTEDENSKPTKPSGGNGTTQVTPIVPEKTDISLKKGKTTTVEIDTTASSLQLEIEDEDVISASLSGKMLTITALKKGTSDIWLRTSNNYASIHVTVTASSSGGPSGGDDDRTEPTEKETEPVTEPPTEEPTEEVTEPPTEEETVNPFTDLPDKHWAKESILTLYSKGIINGMDEDTFAPDEFVTRAQFVTMLTKAFDLTSSTPISAFDDVKTTSWYFKAVMAAYENNIATGYGGKFNPSSLVTRQEMATFAYRAAINAGIKFSLGNTTNFSDHESIASYALEAVYSMRSKGVINGMTSTTFEPLGNATRAQAAHIIAKLMTIR
ncbi:MAG: S-layer homology domain-containing protein [Clostridia bacterium]|nr:S-layer homology domain-containing protein [Clostridia bacterium]